MEQWERVSITALQKGGHQDTLNKFKMLLELCKEKAGCLASFQTWEGRALLKYLIGLH
jgi:hypothetical protein